NVSRSARPLRSCAVKSARNRAPSIPDNVGRSPEGATAGLLISIAELATRQSDEYIVERDLTSGHLAHAGVIFVLLDEPSRRIDGEKLATVANGDPMPDGLRLFHGKRGNEDAPADVALPLDRIP